MRTSSSVEYYSSPLRRYLVLGLITILGYLCQVCIMPYVQVLGVTPNLLYAVIAIVTVAYGRIQALWLGVFYGLLLEIMLPSVPFLSLGLYTVTSLLASFVFADRSAKSLEMDRALNRKSRIIPAWLRTVLCAMTNVFAYETVNIVYIYISGSPLTISHFLRGLADVFTTGLLTLAIEFPIRRLIFGKRVITPVLKNQPIVFGKK